MWLLSKGLLTKTILVSGQLKTDGTVLNCMFVAPGLFTDDVSLRLFSEPPNILAERRVFTPFLASFLRTASSSYDVCITVLAKEYSFIVRPIATYVGQSLVNQKIDTSRGWEGVRENLSRTKRKGVNNFEAKYRLSCTISVDPSDLSGFYHHMFLPNSIARF